MNTILLGVIRSELERRNAPAVRALRSQAGNDSNPPEAHPNILRRFRNHAGEVVRAARFAITVKKLRGKRFVLPGVGHKMDEVRAELIEAGVPSADIEYLPEGGRREWRLEKAVSFWIWLILAAGVRACLLRRLSSHSRHYANVIFQYAIMRLVLRRHPREAYWCVIGDLSPTLIALAGAVRAEGHKLLSWQYGYQDFKRFPVRPDVAVVLNANGLELARVADPNGSVAVFQRKTIAPKRVSFKEVSSGTVGVVLNAFSRKDIVETIHAIARHLDRPVLVRPHPRDQEMRKLIESPNVKLAANGSLDEFCASVDWVICGNTTSALKIRAMGFPVCQYFGLDFFFTDHFGYQEMGIIPGFGDVSDISVTKIKRFYDLQQDSAVLERVLGRTEMDDVHGLDDIAGFGTEMP